MNTPLLENPETNRLFTSRIPLGRWGKVEEVGQLAVYLCSEDAGFIKCTDVLIDGGWCAQARGVTEPRLRWPPSCCSPPAAAVRPRGKLLSSPRPLRISSGSPCRPGPSPPAAISASTTFGTALPRRPTTAARSRSWTP